jgi:hypothetical protein
MPNPVETPEKKQLDKDVNDVFVTGIRKLSEFPADYQEILKASYRFSATRYDSDEEIDVNRTSDTLDII